MPQDPVTDWLERFLQAHPEGRLPEFDAWADEQAPLMADPDLRARVRGKLEAVLVAAHPFARSPEEQDGSVLGRRNREVLAGGREGGAGAVGALEEGSEALKAGRRIGEFVLERFIAKGGMGQVWEARDDSVRRQVALKLVLPDRIDERSLALFAREARAGGRVNHPNLVTTLGYGTDEGLAWIAQELVPGSWTLKDSLDAVRSEETVPKGYYREVAELVAAIADGMQAAHEAGVIHRDLKPQNILIDDEDRPKVTDFGLARVSEDSFLSQSGDFGGTWAYMSPEQVTAKRMGLDHRTDVFSLGVVLYEMLTLRRPFEGDTTHQIATRIITDDPPEAHRVRSQCPRDLGVVCAKAMEKAPDRRYGTMREFAADLRRHLADEPIQARPAGALVRGTKWVRRHPAISSAGAIGGVALVVVSLLSLNLARQTRIAQDNERAAEASATLAAQEKARAQANAEEAQRNADLATRRANDVLSLSATKDLEDLVSEAETLWPAHPEMLPRYERWLADAQVLLDGRPGDPEAGVKARPSLADHEAKLAELVARSVPQTDEDRLAQAREHESYPELERARGELTWRRRMLGQEEWPDPAEVEVQVAGEDLPTDAGELLALARGLVGPAAEDLGQATRGWVLAGLALEADPGEDGAGHYPRALMTMGWAEARLGRGDAARTAMEQALAEQEAADALAAEEAAAAGEDSDALEALRSEARALEEFLARWEGAALEEREAELPDLGARITTLEIEVGERVFEDAEDGWWQRQLAGLVRGIRGLHDPENGLAGNTRAEPFGWGVVRRVEFAEGIEERSVAGKEAARLWAEAIAAIGVSEHYGGLSLAPQLGLLPIGPDPDSGLWEFAHLQTGDPAVRGADGKLVLTEETGLVFVLIPGGTFWMGAQSTDPEGRNHDPQARSNEGPVHQVTLSPYFLSKYEMTQGQWKHATAANPSSYGPDGSWGSNLSRGHPEASLLHPVEQVTWTDCMDLMARLGLELPSEAQWENGCRAGTDSVYWSGDDPAALQGVGNVSDQYAKENGAAAWATHEAIDDGNTVHARVGSYRPNGYGLHEVHGNVWEWCRDGYQERAYAADGRTDPVVPWTGSSTRVGRGGGFFNTARDARSADRNLNTPGYRGRYLGLRPARGITTPDSTASTVRVR